MVEPDYCSLEVGQDLSVSVLWQRDDNSWAVHSDSIPSDCKSTLRSRDSRMYAPGDLATVWIVHINEKYRTLLLADSQFGRLPISDRMRPRYVRALDALLCLLDEETDPVAVPVDAISEGKGMYGRCVKKDQWDWFTVFQLLGRPHYERSTQVRQCLTDIVRAANAGDGAELMRTTIRLRAIGLEDSLRVARSALVSSALVLAGRRPINDPFESARGGDNVGDTKTTPSYVLSAATRVKTERANAEHARTLQRLVDALQVRGYVVEHSQLLDAFCRLKTGPAVFEVKSLSSSNERSQCRQALSQLYEYRYLYGLDDASLWLVLSARPATQWLVDYLHKDRGLKLLWLEGHRLQGPSLALLDQSVHDSSE